MIERHREVLIAAALAAVRDLPEENVWEYASKHYYLGGKQALVQRFFDPDLTPYTKIFQEAPTGQFSRVHPDDWWLQRLLERGQRVDEFFALKSSQSGFTQAALNIIAYISEFMAGRGLYCIDSREKAGRLCNLRLLPLLKAMCSSELGDDAFGNFWIELKDWVWEMVGSYSSGVFSEKPLTHAFLDDVAYFVTEGGKRGVLDGVHVIDHARSRFTTADAHFLAVFSKPDLEEDQFVREWRGGSQHEWHVPCPLCNALVVLELEHLFFDRPECRDLLGQYDLEAVEQLAGVRCPRCDGVIEERWKGEMNRNAWWLPKSAEKRHEDKDPLLVPRRLSVRVNDMVSPFKEVRWGKLARLMIEAEGRPEKKKFVLTNHGARPWKEHAVRLELEQVKALVAGWRDGDYVHGEGLGVKPYVRGQCPFLPDVVIATADRQGDKKKWMLCGWKADGTCAVIDYGATLADQALLDLTENPVSSKGRPFEVVGFPEVRIFAGYGLDGGGCLIDSGFETFEVYDFCIDSGWRWYPSKGVKGLDISGYLVEAKKDFYKGEEILRYHYHDYAVKVALYKGIIARHTHKDPQRRRRARLVLPRDMDEGAMTELISESLQPDPKTGRMGWVHDKSIGPNDYGDALKMQLPMWQLVGPQLAMTKGEVRTEEPVEVEE